MGTLQEGHQPWVILGVMEGRWMLLGGGVTRWDLCLKRWLWLPKRSHSEVDERKGGW